MTKLPFATLRPVPRQVPRQAAVLHCPDHNLPACERCKMRRRGVRNCCRLGHHKEDYWHKPQSKGICSTHSMKICDRCQINKRGVQYCCRNGHHDTTRRKPGPKVGSKRLVEEQGQVSQKRRRMQGSVSDREAVRDSTPPTAPTLSNMRPRSNSAPQLGGASSASLYLAALGPRPGGGGMHKCTPPRASRMREQSTPGHRSGERPKRARAVLRGGEGSVRPPNQPILPATPPESDPRPTSQHPGDPGHG